MDVSVAYLVLIPRRARIFSSSRTRVVLIIKFFVIGIVPFTKMLLALVVVCQSKSYVQRYSYVTKVLSIGAL